MRRVALSILLSTFAIPAFAQQGALSLDAMASPGRHFGMSYNVTDHLSLRPTVGLGFSGSGSFSYRVGADVRFELQPLNTLTAYATASLFYGRDGQEQVDLGQGPGSGGVLLTSAYQGLSVGGGLGLRRRINNRFAAFAEARAMHSSVADVSDASSFGRYPLDRQNRIEMAAGVSLTLR